MIKRLIRSAFILLLVVAILLPLAASAEEPPSAAYTYSIAHVEAVPSPPMYLPDQIYLSKDLGMGLNLNNPKDLFVHKKSARMFIADTENNRILVMDLKTRKMTTKYEGLWYPLSDSETARYVSNTLSEQDKGEVKRGAIIFKNGIYYHYTTFSQPKGIFVNDAGEIWICDTGNKRVVCIDSLGVLQHVLYSPPQSQAIASDFQFQPEKVVQDKGGSLYVTCFGGLRGAFIFLADGTFVGFYGAASVEVTLQVVIDRFVSRFVSKEHRKDYAKTVPTEINNLFLDDQGFIYTTIGKTQSNTNQLRRLNYAGNNVLINRNGNTRFGDLTYTYMDNITWVSELVDVTADENGFVTVLDKTYGRIFQYDQEANLLIAQNKGGIVYFNQRGTVKEPSSIEIYDKELFVLDAQMGTISTYKISEYGSQLQKAIMLYNQGLYDESILPWREVLKRNANLELAYTGLGRAYFFKGDYEKALHYSKLGFDNKTYSVVFREYRTQFLLKYFNVIAFAVILLIASPFIISKVKKRRAKKLYSLKGR